MVRQTPRAVVLALAGVALVHAGCLKTRDTRPEAPVKEAAKPSIPPPKPGTLPSLVYSNWNKNVEIGTDPVSNTTIAGISGRVYLLDKDAVYPLMGDGKMSVELYDDSPRADGGASKLLEVWNLDPETLKKLEQKDLLGTAYVMALPWSTYRQDIRQIHMAVKYEPKTGQPLLWTGTAMTIDHGSAPVVTHTTTRGPALGPVMASAKN